ncbi:DIP1984 family protein [Oscillochloris sp. ZM17-4]|uniref:DIP1984 family protein n=1 Tax=Oscillochloris sp. ZM17-4 TaxID=2866714 RepID=UPI001C7312EB|nr:DIP1984 family protein [Oscillochloris sp. ZM17-4]MBX0326614.1 DIP1984 family protein [Oscillochloris sp. ZM17-4]
MKLAEALVERKAAQQKLAELNERLQRVAVVQEGERPAEEPAALLAEVGAVAERLEGLILAINRTNSQADLADGRSITAAIARRDVLRMRQGVLDALLRSVGSPQYRARGAEIKFVPTVAVPELQRERDALAKAYRELDAAIQAANWAVDLQEV